ncbi:MAG: PorT family protein [Sphingobacteriales bacterium]|nr:MAG: PorT family protein [Sphingobacteriales bacterium]
MKKISALLLCFLALQNYAFSQGFSATLKHSSIQIGPTYSNWSNYNDEKIDMRETSNLGFDLALTQRFPFGKKEITGLNVGLGVSNVNLHTNFRTWEFDEDGAVLGNHILMDPDKYLKNKLSLTYIEIPLELSFAAKRGDSTKTKPGFKFALGWRTGICVDAHNKYKTEDAIDKRKDFDNINRLRYGPTVRIGFGMFSIYGRYDLSSTFKATNVPNYNLYSAGIIFSGY